MDCSDVIQKSQYYIPIERACIILYNTVKKSSCVRQAKFYDGNPEDIESKMIGKCSVGDIKNRNNKDKFIIIFYGSQELADQLSADLNSKLTNKKDVIVLSDSQKSFQSTSSWNLRKRNANQIPSSQPTSSSTPKRMKAQQDLDSNLQASAQRHDICLKNIQKDLTDLVQYVKQELIEVKTTLYELKKDLKSIDVQPQLRRQYISGAINPVSQLCIEQMEEHRNTPGWYTKIKSLDWNSIGLTEDQATNMQYVLTEENNPSILVGSIAYTIFGDKLVTHLLGKNGCRDRKAKKNDRSLVFSSEEESKLRQVLSLFGSTFTNDTVWKKIVIYYVNQKGRDLKRKQEQSNDTSERSTVNEPELDSEEEVNHDHADPPMYDEDTRSPNIYNDGE